jgi:hypothetical protein
LLAEDTAQLGAIIADERGMRVARTPETPPSPGLDHPEASTVIHRGSPNAEASAARSGPTAFSELLRGLGQALDQGENVTQTALRAGAGHGAMSAERLIALQAGIYRYSEAVDLVTKVVDKGTQAVRTTLQNQ